MLGVLWALEGIPSSLRLRKQQHERKRKQVPQKRKRSLHRFTVSLLNNSIIVFSLLLKSALGLTKKMSGKQLEKNGEVQK